MSLVKDEAKQAQHAQAESTEAAVDAALSAERAKPRPDPVVKESEIRRSIDVLTRGITEQQHKSGMLPMTGGVVRDFVVDATMDTVKRHEERFRNGPPEAHAVTEVEPSPAQLDSDPHRIERRLGSVILQPGMAPVNVDFKPKPKKPIDPLLQARADMLLNMPDWHQRIVDAYTQGLARPGGTTSSACDAVMEIIESSNRLFGDWRDPPKPKGPLIIVGA